MADDAPIEITWEKFTKLPNKLVFGAVVVCPRCRARTRKYDYQGLVGPRHKDRWVKRKPCLGCNGFGVIPNKGPIAAEGVE